MVRIAIRWAERIVSDPEVMTGKPVVKGTRIPVEAVLAHMADNPDIDDLFGAYPKLTIDDVKACLDYAADKVRLAGRRKSS